MNQAKDAFDNLTSCCEENEKEYLEEHFEDCVEDITEEEFEEKYDGDAYKLPLDNVMCTFGDLRLVRDFFAQQEEKQRQKWEENEKQKQNVPVDWSSISDDDFLKEMKKRFSIKFK